MIFWKISQAELVPKLSRVYFLSPLFVAKVVMYRLSGLEGLARRMHLEYRSSHRQLASNVYLALWLGSPSSCLHILAPYHSSLGL